MSCEHTERDLEAYLDRELDAESATAVRDHVRACAVCRRRVDERDALSRLIRAAPYYPAPDRLRMRVVAEKARPASMRRFAGWAAAAVLVVSMAGGISLLRSTPGRSESIAEEAVNSHVRSLMASHLFDVQSTDQHTVKPWFLGKLDFAPPVVDLSSIGFPLVGGRLDYLDGRPVAALVYQRQKHTINVFVLPGLDETSVLTQPRSVRGFHVGHWMKDGMSYWAVSDLNEAELTAFTRALASFVQP